MYIPVSVAKATVTVPLNGYTQIRSVLESPDKFVNIQHKLY